MRRPVLVLIVVFTASLFAGCQHTSGPSGLRIEWDIEAHDRFLEETSARMADRPRNTGTEIWWTNGEELVICSRGVLPDGQIGRRTLWVLPREEVVYELDVWEEVARGMPYAQWVEERRRLSRSKFVTAYPALATEANYEIRQRYGGTLRRRIVDDEVWLSAVPLWAWRIETDGPRIDWTIPMLTAGMNGTLPKYDRRIGRILDEIQPSSIEYIQLPDAQSAWVISHTISSVDETALDEDIRRKIQRGAEQVDDFESEWKTPEALWRIFADSIERPLGFEFRDVRHRLEPFVTNADTPRILDGLAESTSVDEYEDCYHLLYIAAPRALAGEFDRALADHRIDSLIAILSVYSLKSTSDYEARYETVIEHLPHTPELRGSRRREVRQWLRAVGQWIKLERGTDAPGASDFVPITRHQRSP